MLHPSKSTVLDRFGKNTLPPRAPRLFPRPLQAREQATRKSPAFRPGKLQAVTLVRSRRTFLKAALLAAAPRWAWPAAADTAPASDTAPTPDKDRQKWIEIVERVSQPVLEAISRQKLRATMPVETVRGHEKERAQSTHLEASPACSAAWLRGLKQRQAGNAAEEKLRARYRDWARFSHSLCTDPQSPDALNFGTNRQSLVDAAFLALAIVRAPNQLWTQLDSTTRQNLVTAMRETRKLQPGQNNWSCSPP